MERNSSIFWYTTCILLVSGASRTPRHQGSVEVSNRSIKIIIHRELVNVTKASKLKSTEPVGWVSVLLQVTSAMNGSIGYGQGLITPYRHVYTQDFEFPLGISTKDRSKICSIESLDKYVNDPALSEKLRIIDNSTLLTSDGTSFKGMTKLKAIV